MARANFSGKTALILGADLPVGRAAALQLSRSGARVVLAGHNEKFLRQMLDLIAEKGGHPSAIVLDDTPSSATNAIREARDDNGHLHYVVNALGTAAAPAKDLEAPGRRAQEFSDVVLGVVEGRGAARFISILTDTAGPGPDLPRGSWHSVVRGAAFQTTFEGEPSDEVLKAAGVADTLVFLLSCPPSACPVEVRLGAVNDKV